ncbi:unnamed protein product [Brassica rapa subsp. narinosa]
MYLLLFISGHFRKDSILSKISRTMNSNSKTSVSGDLTSAKLVNSAGEPVNRSSETADSSVVARPKRGITGDSSANAVAGEARYKKRQGKAVVSSDKSDAVLLFRCYEHGIVIQGFIPPGRIDTYLPHLVAGSIYRLTNFYGSKSKIVYRVVEPNVTVTFFWNSVLSVSADSTVGFPEDRIRFYGHKEFDEA